jgi:long-chain acyl-CoA synthetase
MANVSTLLDSKSVPSSKPALIQPSTGTVYSYGTLRSEMNRVAHGLSALGIDKGDRVCIYLDSSPEYLVSYFALWRIGAIAVPANSVYRGDELLHAVRDAGASAIITDTNGARFVD